MEEVRDYAMLRKNLTMQHGTPAAREQNFLPKAMNFSLSRKMRKNIPRYFYYTLYLILMMLYNILTYNILQYAIYSLLI